MAFSAKDCQQHCQQLLTTQGCQICHFSWQRYWRVGPLAEPSYELRQAGKLQVGLVCSLCHLQPRDDGRPGLLASRVCTAQPCPLACLLYTIILTCMPLRRPPRLLPNGMVSKVMQAFSKVYSIILSHICTSAGVLLYMVGAQPVQSTLPP